MSLTKEDLGQIKGIVKEVVDESVNGATKGLATRDEMNEGFKSLRADLDRMEARLITSMNLLQRDTFTRLDEHEVRIARLEARR